MKSSTHRGSPHTLLVAVLILCAGAAAIAENVDPADDGSQYAWGENIGWLNAEPQGEGGPGLEVSDSDLTGWVWGENIGWISLSCVNTTSCGTQSYGVANNCGVLSGFAWAENVGWINFSPATGGVGIDPLTGEFSGTAWGENTGWITFADDAPVTYGVLTSWNADADADSLASCGSGADNCPTEFNPSQDDADADGVGNTCDLDNDNDGILDDGDGSGTPGDAPCVDGGTVDCDDNCPFDPNPLQDKTACAPVFCDLVVGPQVGTDFPTIAAAMPSTSDGCTVLVKPGTYTAPVTVSNFIRLVAEDGPATTILDTGALTAISIPGRQISGSVRIEGLTIRSTAGGIDTDETIRLSNSRIEGVTPGGTALRLGLGAHELRNVDVAVSGGTGVEVVQFATATLNRVRVEGATTGLDIAGDVDVMTSLVVDNPGTAVQLQATGSLDIRFSTMSGNGVGLDAVGAPLVADHVIVHGNTTDVTGAACASFSFSDLGIDCTGSGGNLSADPLFVNSAGGNYRILTLASPVIDAGRPPELYTGVPCLDYDGVRRLLDANGDGLAHPDMGPYEFDNSGPLSPDDPQNLTMPDNTTLDWDDQPSSSVYQIERGTLSTLGYDYLLDLVGTSATSDFTLTTELPASGDVFVYVVSGKDAVAEEGTLGFGTCAERSNFTPSP